MTDEALFGGAYAGKTALVTGHTGFKGSWLALWLEQLGCRVIGFSLPPTDPKLCHIGVLSLRCRQVIGDIGDRERLAGLVKECRPDVIFHLAAQALVRRSYRDPAGTFETNALGTVSLYEAARQVDSVRAVVCVTSDKVYENREWAWGYREPDPLGGHDPYSCSKACAELITSCYRKSFFNLAEYGRSHQTLLATARAGNVIGGGDWAEDRLVPDLVRATTAGRPLVLRNPGSVRPWQHVLDPVSGYLQLGQKLLEGQTSCAEEWNFGPDSDGAITVERVVRQFCSAWPRVRHEAQPELGAPHEAGLLRLDCSKARSKMGWVPVWKWTEAVTVTADWYRQFYETGEARTRRDLAAYIDDARRQNLPWSRA